MPLRAGVAARIRVNRQEQVGVLAIGDRGSLLERNVNVGAAGQHDLDAELLLQQLLEAQRDIERQRRFGEALGDRARIAAAVAGIDDDARHAQSELPRDRESARGVRHWRSR